MRTQGHIICKVDSIVPGSNECLINMAGPIVDFHHFFHSFGKHVLIANSVSGTVLSTRDTAENKTDQNYGACMRVEILK